MKSIQLLFTAISILFAVNTSMAFDNDVTSICARPGTDELYIGGEFNKVMVVNKKTGETIRQITITTKVIDMQFNPSGNKLIIYDGAKVFLVHPETGEETYSFEAEGVKLFENSPYMIHTDWFYTESVTVYSTEDGSIVYVLKPTFPPMNVGLNATHDQLIVLGTSMAIEDEKSLIQSVITASEDYNLYNSAYVTHQEDGRGAGFMVVDLKTKAELLNVIIPYALTNSFALSISKYKEDYFISSWDALLKIDKTGKCFPIEVEKATFAYATNTSRDGQAIFVSTTKDGFIYNCEAKTATLFNANDTDEFIHTKDLSYSGEEVYLLGADFSIAIMNNKGIVSKRLKITPYNSEK